MYGVMYGVNKHKRNFNITSETGFNANLNRYETTIVMGICGKQLKCAFIHDDNLDADIYSVINALEDFAKNIRDTHMKGAFDAAR